MMVTVPLIFLYKTFEHCHQYCHHLPSLPEYFLKAYLLKIVWKDITTIKKEETNKKKIFANHIPDRG
jgi:hypothetical protein